MKFGLFSNDRRPARGLGEAWRLDLDEVVTADEIGFSEAWFSEHQAPAELLIAKACAMTRQIMLGSAVRPLPYYHPLQVAIEANAADQLTGGRYMLGVGPGFGPHRVAWRGNDPAQVREMTAASVELLLRLLNGRDTPIDYDGPFWTGRKMVVEIPPVREPHAPIALAVAHSPDSAAFAGKHGFMVLTSDFVSTRILRAIGDAMVAGQLAAGRPAARSQLRVARVVYVRATDAQARDELRDSYNATIKWEIANTPWHQEDRIPPGGSFDDITFDYLVDNGNLLVGSPETVARMIGDVYEQVGGFGTLLFHSGRDYATPAQYAASMRLFARAVAPLVRHLDPDARGRAEVAA